MQHATPLRPAPTLAVFKINPQIRMAETKIESPLDVFNLFIEYFVFYRWMFFKNRPRGNFLLIRALLAIGMFGFVYYQIFGRLELMLAGIDIDPAIAIAGAAIIGYWNMSKVFHQKSEYCSSLHDEIIKQIGSGNHKTAGLLQTTLSLHLLSMDLWAHRSYMRTFARTLEQSIDTYCVNAVGIDKSAEKQKIIDRVNNGKFTNREARNMLEGHLESLMASV